MTCSGLNKPTTFVILPVILALLTGCERNPTGVFIGDLEVRAKGEGGAYFDATVYLLKGRNNQSAPQSDRGMAVKQCDRYGWVYFKKVDAGDYTLVIHADDYQEYRASITVEDNRTTTHIADLIIRRGNLTVSVLVPDGSPAIGAEVMVITEQHGHNMFTYSTEVELTGSEGQAFFEDIWVGDHCMRVWADAYYRFIPLIRVQADTTVSSTVELLVGKSYQSSSDDTGLDPAAREWYREDAAVLAVEKIWATVPKEEQEVELPADLIDGYYRALISIHNCTDLAACDSALTIYQIHPAWCLPDVRVRDILVTVDTTRAWTQAWISGQRITGNPEIDSLMVQYDLYVEDTVFYLSGDLLVNLRSPRPINTVPLAAKFKWLDGVIMANRSGYGVIYEDWKDCIEPSECSEGILLEFRIYHYGFYREWRFQVLPDDRVALIARWP